MDEVFWHYHDDFLKVPASQVVNQFWEDDELNRQRSLSTFREEMELVDKGLALYIQAIQGAFMEYSKWKEDLCMRACIGMLKHALNVFLAWRQLISLGYLSEARIFARSIHESLSQALVFSADEKFAMRFYDGRQINPRDIRKRLSQSVDAQVTADDAYSQFNKLYVRLSQGAHPTLNSFSMRTIAQEHSDAGLRKSVPEDVVMGGLLEEHLGRIAWLGLAHNIALALGSIGLVLRESSGGWKERYRAYRSAVEDTVRSHNAFLDETFSQ